MLALDDVVDFDDLWWPCELDTALGEDRHQAFTERLELLHRVPDLADAEAAAGAEGDVVVEPSGGNSPAASMRGNTASYFSAVMPVRL